MKEVYTMRVPITSCRGVNFVLYIVYMKILVTGCAGFIGSNLSEYLINKGYEVVGIDNFNEFYSPAIKEFNISEFKDNVSFKLYRENLLNKPKISEIFENEKPNAVVHLAAWANVTQSVKDPHTYAEENYVATSDLAEICVNNGVNNFIFASTSSVYGNENNPPFTEDMKTDFPAGPYPASKKSSEVLLYTFNLNFGLNVLILRFFNPIGPRLRPDMATPKLIRAAEYGYEFPVYQNPEKSSRDYTYIGNMCEAIEYGINNPLKYEIINLGNSKPETLIDLIKAVENSTGKKIKTVETPLPGQMTTTCADITKARQLLKYNPSVNLEQMIKIYYDWFIKQPEWYKKGNL